MSKINFRVSSGLKNIIGRELITDEFVAIFELVKNSFDAYASRIDLYFDNNSIYIIDNGKGMSKDDILNKWLFVAYSAKADDTEDNDLDLGYRKDIRANRKAFAGNKGVGRFSCDSLGENLVLQSRCNAEGVISQIEVDWNKFEDNTKEEFGSIDVNYSEIKHFDIPAATDISLSSGTILKITNLRSENGWERSKLLKLRPALAKLVDPFGSRSDLDLYIHAPLEIKIDKDIYQSNLEKDAESPYTDTVNGKVKNLVFEKLSIKTTNIKTWLEDSCVYTELIDRGERVYLIKENNPYGRLNEIKLNIDLYYMNTKAKINFTKLMGVEVKNFGSVFLFNNGFRVYPFGEPDDDSLGLNTRKAQGYARFLGTRELLGKIYIEGAKFKESTSRDQGLINTPAYKDLKEFFLEKSLKRLESYVVGVSWPDKLDQDSEDLNRLLTDQGKGRVVSVVSKLVSGKEIELLDYSEALIDLVNERSESFEQTLEQLQEVAIKSGDQKLQERIDRSLVRFNELKEAEEASRKNAEMEKAAREKAEKKADEIESTKKLLEKKLTTVEKAYQEEQKRNLFLIGISSRDLESIINFHHQIGIYSSAINHLIQLTIDRINHNNSNSISIDDLFHLLENISLKNQQILAISRFATKANFRTEAEEIEEDLILFSQQYLTSVAREFNEIEVEWIADGTKWPTKFKPIEMTIVIDNLVNNAKKACASKITFKSTNNEKNRLLIEVYDDGKGFPKHLSEVERIFERGVSTTDGSGLGLYHVKQIINEMGGSIDVDSSFEEGAKFKIRFAK